MAPYSGTLSWKIPWMEKPGRLQSTWSQKSQTRLSYFTFTLTPRKIKIVIVDVTNRLIISALEKVMKAVGMDPCPILD